MRSVIIAAVAMFACALPVQAAEKPAAAPAAAAQKVADNTTTTTTTTDTTTDACKQAMAECAKTKSAKDCQTDPKVTAVCPPTAQ